MDTENLKDKLKNSIEDTELPEGDRAYITGEAKIAALLYHALITYGIPSHLAESLTRDYFNSRLGCDCEDGDGEEVPAFGPDNDPVRFWIRG